MIMKQEAQKFDLKEALKIERSLRQELLNLTEILDVSNVNMFPTYVQTMTKALLDQSGDLKKLR